MPIRTKFVLRTFLIVVSLAKLYLLIDFKVGFGSVVQHGSDQSVSALPPGLWFPVQQLKRCDCSFSRVKTLGFYEHISFF